MVDQPRLVHDAASLLASQRTYYDARADEYGDESRPDRNAPGLMPINLGRALVDEFAPTGDVLELACGTGFFTRELARHAGSLTAVDASPRLLAINRARVDAPNVTYVQADLFAWAPDRRYDAVFFGFWLSHVPPDVLADFWALVRRCLAPGGRVAFVDEDARAASQDEGYATDGVPAARRRLSDGRQFEIVKVFWWPDALENRLRALGWDVSVWAVGETFLYGADRRKE